MQLLAAEVSRECTAGKQQFREGSRGELHYNQTTLTRLWQVVTAFAHVAHMPKLRLGPEIVESGPLPNLMDAASAVAWQVLRSLHTQYLPARPAFLGAASPVRLDAFENYIRGVIASTRPEKIRRLREALRINPQYDLANFQLGRTYFEARDYQNALACLAKVSRTGPEADQAS